LEEVAWEVVVVVVVVAVAAVVLVGCPADVLAGHPGLLPPESDPAPVP
jgi:hypothetical protein